MLEQITNWANNNQGLVAIIVPIFIIFVAIIGYLVKRFLFNNRAGKNLIQKQKGGDNAENYQAGGDINIQK